MCGINCWEYTNCGKQAGGSAGGACPASTCTAANSIHSGRNGGRVCWALDGTLCNGKGPRSSDEKTWDCMRCAFYLAVHQQESAMMISPPEIRTLVYGRP